MTRYADIRIVSDPGHTTSMPSRAPLYHATNIALWPKILASNRLVANSRTTTGISLLRTRTPGPMSAPAHVRGLSTTRDYAFADNWAYEYLYGNIGVILVLDQDVVRAHNKMVPTVDSYPRKSHQNPREEFVIGDIEDLGSALIGLGLSTGGRFRDGCRTKDMPTLEAVATHPLFGRAIPQAWIPHMVRGLDAHTNPSAPYRDAWLPLVNPRISKPDDGILEMVGTAQDVLRTVGVRLDHKAMWARRHDGSTVCMQWGDGQLVMRATQTLDNIKVEFLGAHDQECTQLWQQIMGLDAHGAQPQASWKSP